MSAGTHTAESGAAGERLDVFLAKTLGLPRSQVQKWFKLGLVQVNGQTERPSYLVEPGDVIAHSEPAAPAPNADAPDLPVVYEDDDILVVDKPAGLAVHSGPAAHVGTTVVDFARRRTTDTDADRPGIVHRLDKDTSGLLIIAKTAAAKAHMQAAFKRRDVHKAYQMLVVGRPDQDQAVIRLPLGRDPARPLQQAVTSGGREAITPYEATRFYPGFTLITGRPQTGRTHQLRVHFAALGHPIAGDTVYGPPKRPLGLKRHFLHAQSLEFTAPSGHPVRLESPLPLDLQTVVNALENAVAK